MNKTKLKKNLAKYASPLQLALYITIALVGIPLLSRALVTVSDLGFSSDSSVSVDSTAGVSVGTASATAVTLGRSGITTTVTGGFQVNGTSTLATTTVTNLTISGSCTGCGSGGGVSGSSLAAGQVAIASSTSAITSYSNFTSDYLGNVTVNSLYAKGTPVFNVKAYGAAGDGTTDDASAVTNALTAASTTGGTIYFGPSSGAYVIKSALTVSANNITIECAPGVTIKRYTAATDLFDWTGSYGTLKGCTLSTNDANNGYLLSLNANNFIARDITVTGTGNNGTAVSSAWLLTTGGSNHVWINLSCGISGTAITNNCIHWDSSSAAISSVRVDGVFCNMDYDVSITSHPACIGVYNETSKQTSNFQFTNIDCQVHGACFGTFEGSGTSFPANIRLSQVNVDFTVGNQSNPIAGINIYGCDNGCSFTDITISDNGKTHFNAPLFALHDTHNYTAGNIRLNTTANSGQCLTALDTARGSLGPGYCGGSKTASPTSVATNGWAAANAGINFDNAASGAEENDNIIHDWVMVIPPSFTGDAIRSSCSTGTASCNHTKIVNNTFYGSGTSTAGTAIHFKYSGSTASNNYGYAAGNNIHLIQNGIVIDSSVLGTVVGTNVFDRVTNLVTDNGTGSAIASHTVAGTGSLSSGTPSTLTVSFSYSQAFTTGHFACTASNVTTPSNAIGVTLTSGSSVTFTGPNSVTDTVAYICSGY